MKWLFRQRSLEDLGAHALTPSHAQSMADIHAQTFKPSWTDGEFADLLSRENVGGVALSEQATDGGAMLGFALVRVTGDEAEILSVAVTPKWQNYGWGRRLMDMLLANLHMADMTKADLSRADLLMATLIEAKLNNNLLLVPNMPLPEVPLGPDDEHNVVLAEKGTEKGDKEKGDILLFAGLHPVSESRELGTVGLRR